MILSRIRQTRQERRPTQSRVSTTWRRQILCAATISTQQQIPPTLEIAILTRTRLV